MSRPAKKPPIGLRPRWIAEEERLKEIAAACRRYHKDEVPIPQHWIYEMVELIERMAAWDLCRNRERVEGRQ